MADQQALIDGLNEDLANEYAAIITYRTYASQVQGQWRVELRSFFEAEIADEWPTPACSPTRSSP
jgi:bacterioferritin